MAAPAKKGGASMRRAGGLADSDVVGSFDDPETRAALTKADKARNAAYRQGQAAAKRRVQETGRTRGHQAAQVHEDPEHQELYESGFGHELGDQRSQRRSERLAPVAQSAGGVAHDGAGVLLGMIGYALFLAYVKGGWPGVTGWLSAKFLNKTKAVAPPAQFTPNPKSAGPSNPTVNPFPVPQGPVGGVGGLYSP